MNRGKRRQWEKKTWPKWMRMIRYRKVKMILDGNGLFRGKFEIGDLRTGPEAAAYLDALIQGVENPNLAPDYLT